MADAYNASAGPLEILPSTEGVCVSLSMCNSYLTLSPAPTLQDP